MKMYLSLFFFFNLQFIHAISSGNETDRFPLLQFKAGISSDPNGIFTSWNHSLPFCRWNGITCGRRHQRVISMVLEGHNLIGSISPFIGNLSFLRILNLQNNTFKGPIPQEIGNLFRLRELYLNNNTLNGEIPVNLTRCSKLRIFYAYKNNLTGKIPAEIGSLRMLELLGISWNNLIGEIPPSLGNLSRLTTLYIGGNMLEGNIPYELQGLTILTLFSAFQNKLSGEIPPFLFNISSLNFFVVTENQLSGSLPNNIGLTLQKLQVFVIGGNSFSGSIPNSFCNASQLQVFQLSQNKFVGQVPNCLGNLPNLRMLAFSLNNLGDNSLEDLTFLTSLKNCSNLETLDISSNNFGGALPKSIGNISVQLVQLYIGGNQITGSIPDSLGNLINLIILGMENNLFTGNIPSSFERLENVQLLDLSQNRLLGQIPSFIGNLTQLSVLELWLNNLQGRIPESIESCKYLQYLDLAENNLSGFIPIEVFHLPSLSRLLNLSQNSLAGHLPMDIGKLININTLDFSGNNLSGEIPTTIGSCSALEHLYMQGNHFQGSIPSSFGSLKGIQELDLSRNNLNGEIPDDLQSLRFLSYLNLSFNNLMGKIPTGGVFQNASEVSLMGNNKLCGGVPELLYPMCPRKTIKNRSLSTGLKLAIIFTCAVFGIMFMLVAVWAYQRRESGKRLSPTAKEMGGLVKVSYTDVYHATAEFSTDNLIGSGSFGSVYRGFLDQLGRQVAIKVIKLETSGASKSFVAECKALRTVRHRNLVKLLTYCSSIDYKNNEFKALVFEFMGKGSLEKLLHDRNNLSRNLNFLQRLNIAIDVASALHYLHDLCESPIVHRDLKPSNVLLDEEMVAHVSDFGLAKLFFANNAEPHSHTSSIGIKGTIGYAPPEYGMGAEASKEGDMYSYGILVLELFTRKRPTDNIFEDHLNMHNFIKNGIPDRLVQIMDPTLLPRGMDETILTIPEGDEILIQAEGNLSRMSAKQKACLISVFEVGVACSTASPQERMTIGEVAKQLHRIRSTFLGVRIYS